MPAVPPRPPGRPVPPVAKTGKPEDPLAKARREKEELAAEVDRIEEEIEELKVRYEMYFLGNERREPVHAREDLKKKVVRAKESFTRNAALRFRIQSLHARFLSYERLWLRSGREKEDGTYRRDLFKARLHARGKAPVGPAAAAVTPAAPATQAQPTPAAASSAASAAKTSAAPPPAPIAKLDEAELRALFDRYVAAKRRCNEDVSKLSYDALARSVAKQVPELLAKHQAKSVEFKVVVKDGKAVLKAIPRS